MLQIYDLFYRSYGIRRFQNLLSPKIFDLSSFHFSRAAVFHSVCHYPEVLFPDPKIPYLAELNKRIYTEHIVNLTSKLGNPRKLNKLPQVITKHFHATYKNFKFLQNARILNKSDSFLDLVNYGLLQELYTYPPASMAEYYKWFNIEKTVWDTIKRTSNEISRQNFVFFNIPARIPSLGLLRIFSTKTNTSMLTIFNTAEKLSVLEFFKWIDPLTRQGSTLGIMTLDEMRKTNIVFTYNGQWSILNLGYFDNWINKGISTEEFKEFEKTNPAIAIALESNTSINTSNIAFNPSQMQKFFLRMLIAIQSSGLITEEDIAVSNNEVEVVAPTTDSIPEYEDDNDDKNELLTKDLHSTSTTIAAVKDNLTPIAEPTVLDEVNITYDDTLDLDNILADLEADLHELEKASNQDLKDKGLIIKGNDLVEHKTDIVNHLHTKENTTIDEVKKAVFTNISDQDTLLRQIDEAAEFGVMSASEYRATVRLANNFLKLPNPYTNDSTISEFGVIKPEDTNLSIDECKLKEPGGDLGLVVDKTMLEARLQLFDKQYIKKVMKKNIVNAVASVRRAGIIIQEYGIENENSLLGDFEIHTIKLKPVEGVTSTIRFKIPVVGENGEYIVNGNKYRLRKLRTDKTIRKIDISTVSLTSYYGKVFVTRSPKKVNDYDDWLIKRIYDLGYSTDDTSIKDLSPTNVFDHMFRSPKIYSALAKNFKSLTVSNYKLILDRKEIINLIPNESDLVKLKQLEGNDKRLIGATANNELLFVNYDNEFLVYDGSKYNNVGNFCDLALIDSHNAPVDFAILKVFSKPIPVVLVLGYLIGLDNLIKLLGMVLDKDYRYVEGNKRVDLSKDEFVIAFDDKKLVINRKHKLGSMVLAGFNEYYKLVKNYSYNSFNNKDIYFNLLDSAKIGARFIKEIDLLDQMFIDPITKDLLLAEKQPITFIGLLVYCSNLLTTDYYPDATNAERIKGYERFSGVIYKELVGAIRNFRGRGIRNRACIELNPYAVWKTITCDAGNIIVADINPIENLKQMEYVTFCGEGGRDKGAINKEARIYQKSDMGVISEATVDSSDVAINTYTSANPLFNSVYGTSDAYDFKKNGATSLLSTSALSSVGSEGDDPKRVNFISIQNSHSVACHGYTQPIVRTGYEQLLAQRTTDMFAFAAEKDGVITEKNDKGIIVKYIDGEEKGIILGRRYGNAEGSTYPHDIVSDLIVGNKVTKGDIIAYNSGFFEPDILNPKNVIWKTSMMVKTALLEGNQTHEDSSAISEKISSTLSAKTTKVRSIVVEFGQNVRNIHSIGSNTHPKDLLCIIEDVVSSNANLLDDNTLDALRRLSNKSPKAKYKGTLDKIEVIYHGDLEDMSPTLRELTKQSDKLMTDTFKAIGVKGHTGSVSSDYRVAGTPLGLDTAEIKFYITIKTNSNTGDKLIFANQMKSVIGEVMDHSMISEDGEEIDAVFGFNSIMARIVTSAIKIGTTATILDLVANRAFDMYYNVKGK